MFSYGGAGVLLKRVAIGSFPPVYAALMRAPHRCVTYKHTSAHTGASNEVIASSSWLKDRLASSEPRKVHLLDCSWTPLKHAKDDYLSKHIPGAVFYDHGACVKSTPTIPQNLPEPSCYQDYLQSLGISGDGQVVVYDRGDMTRAARAWWILTAYGHPSVRVLDGGLHKWELDGYETSDKVHQPPQENPQRGDFLVQRNMDKTKNFEDMQKVVKFNSSQIIDVRRMDNFFGKEDEPSAISSKTLSLMGQPIPSFMHKGIIPGSKLLILEHLVDKNTTCLLPKDQLLRVFSELGIDLEQPLITTCYIGHRACLAALAALVCGKDDTALYYGSWTEYGQRASDDEVAQAK